MNNLTVDITVEEVLEKSGVFLAEKKPVRKRTPKVPVEIVIPDYTDGADQTTFRTTMDPYMVPPILKIIEEAPIVAFDVETTGLDYLRDQLHGLALATADLEWYVCGNALPVLLKALQPIAEAHPDKLWLAHNAKFDLHFLAPCGFRPEKVADTMVAQWMVDENLELGLKKLAHTRLGYPVDLPTYDTLLQEAKSYFHKKKKSDVTIYDIPVHRLGEYSARDTRMTFELWQKLEYDLSQEHQTAWFWEIEMPFLYILLDMEAEGLWIDQQGMIEVEGVFREEMNKSRSEWDQLTKGVNPNSSKQLGKYLFEDLKLPKQGLTKGGQLATDDLVLQRLEPMDSTGSVKALRTTKKYEKLIGTYIETFWEKMYEGRLHGSFNPCGTVTGRLSSSDPNLQNIPSRGKLGKLMRKIFGAAPGYTLVVCDYSQIELRMLANESREPAFIKIFEEDGDPHEMTAELTHVERPVGKTINFGWSYGMGPGKLADTLEKAGNPRPSQTESRNWLDSFNAAYPVLVCWKESVIRRSRQLGYVPTVGGRRRHLPDLMSPIKSERGRAERQCVNARIQGSCADMIKWSMLQLHPWTRLFGARMLAQVHDELVFEVPEDQVANFIPVVQDCMEAIVEKFGLRVKVIAEPGFGPNWAEAKG